MKGGRNVTEDAAALPQGDVHTMQLGYGKRKRGGAHTGRWIAVVTEINKRFGIIAIEL